MPADVTCHLLQDGQRQEITFASVSDAIAAKSGLRHSGPGKLQPLIEKNGMKKGTEVSEDGGK